MSTATSPSEPIPASKQLAVTKLVFDTELQCRVEVDDDVVAEYAEAMSDGDVFPPIRVVTVGKKHLVVDGWHRAYAAKKAKVKLIDAVVSKGTRRDALLLAVQANGQHGLRRSTDDKRRAVRTLLGDAEWCALSNRELAKLARVSHAFVGQTRRHYQLARGEALTAERIDEIDGEPTAEWLVFADQVESYYRTDLLDLRKCFTLTELARQWAFDRDSKGWVDAFTLQLRRIAERCGDPWPWKADTTAEQRAARVRTLTDPLDLAAAITSPDCPDRLAAARVWRLTGHIPTAHAFQVETWAAQPKYEGWTGLHSLLAARLAEAEAEAEALPPSPYEEARRIEAMKNGQRQLIAIRAASEEVQSSVCVARCTPDGRSELRYIRGQVDSTDCEFPGCDGWLEARTWGEDACSVCVATAEETTKRLDRAVQDVYALVCNRGTVTIGERILTHQQWAELPGERQVHGEVA